MPQFVPPPLMATEDDAPAPLSHDVERFSRFERETLRPVADMARLCEQARQGAIPDSLRPEYWMLMLGYLPAVKEKREAVRATALQDYEVLVKTLLNDFGDFSLPNSDDPKRIDIDIPRTLPTLHFYAAHEPASVSPTPSDGLPEEGGSAKSHNPKIFTRNQQSLRRILHLFARLNAGSCYVQGMNELVGHMLYAFAKGKGSATMAVEADVFFSFQRLHQFVGDNFQREIDMDANGIKGTLAAFDALLHLCDPETHQFLAALGVVPEFYAFRWLTLMFSQEFFTPEVLSLWDFLLSFRDDLDAIILFTAVAMVSLVRDRLLGESFGHCIQLLQSYPHHEIEMKDIKIAADALMKRHGARKARTGRSGSRPTSPASQGDSCEPTGERRVWTDAVNSIGRAAHSAGVSLRSSVASWMSSGRQKTRDSPVE